MLTFRITKAVYTKVHPESPLLTYLPLIAIARRILWNLIAPKPYPRPDHTISEPE